MRQEAGHVSGTQALSSQAGQTHFTVKFKSWMSAAPGVLEVTPGCPGGHGPRPPLSPLLPTSRSLCRRATVTHQAAQLPPHCEQLMRPGRAAAPLWSQTAHPRLLEPICLLRSKAGTWPTQNQSSQDVQENQERLTPSGRIRSAKTNLCRRDRGWGPRTRSLGLVVPYNWVWGSFKQAPPSKPNHAGLPGGGGWGEFLWGAGMGSPADLPSPSWRWYPCISGDRRGGTDQLSLRCGC